jgi:tetratricopeptide (TPR) repeat protein
MFLPLAVPAAGGFQDVEAGGLDAGVLSRRFPDFAHQVLNQGQIGPTGMLELQSPPDEGPVTWVVLDTPPEPEDAFEMLPSREAVRAVVTGEIAPVHDGLRVEFHVYHAEDAEERLTTKVGGIVTLADPVAGLLPIVRRLARVLELPFHEPPRGLMTGNGRAFFRFLQGLDNAMLLSGDLQIAVPGDREALMRPFMEALQLDPGFGLALRVAHSTMSLALQDARLDQDAVRRFLDACYSVQPFDGDGCVAVAEQLCDMGDEKRAIAWLQHATHLDPPPARGLENLGIMFANRGDTVAARDLWLRGVDLDGHPDFFAHLARLYFAEDRALDAWDMVIRGLRRLHERTARAREWEDYDRGPGVLLHYLHEHIGELAAPADAIDALLDLRGMLDGEAQVELGFGQLGSGLRVEARQELAAGLHATDLSNEVRDLAVRALLNLDVADFEQRFRKATDRAQRGRNPRGSLPEFQVWLQLQPEFWPALFFAAIAKRRLGESETALDLLANALRLSPGQPDVLREMARLFDDRGNPKRALELVDEALRGRRDDARLLAARVRFLERLHRGDDARRALAAALAAHPRDQELRRLRRRLAD